MRLSPYTVLRFALSLAAAVMGALAVSPSLAVQPGSWAHTTEADFEAGKKENTVVTNLGDIKLAAGTRTLGTMPEKATVLYDMQRVGKDLYLAAGPEGKVLRRDGEKFEIVATYEGEQVFSLDTTADGKLLMAVSGEESRLERLEDGKPVTLAKLPGIRYIWDMVVHDGIVYLATGTEGRLLRVDLAKAAEGLKAAAPDAAKDKSEPETDEDDIEQNEEDNKPKALSLPGITELLHTAQANLLCLAKDGKGRLYAGTDTDGLLYRITLKADGAVDEAFVLYDAAEPEIGAIVVTPEGDVYAGTADAEQAKPGRLSEAEASSPGRPGAADGAAAPVKPGEQEPGKPEEPGKPGDIPQVPPAPKPVTPTDEQDTEPMGDVDVEGATIELPTPSPQMNGNVPSQGVKLKLPEGIDLNHADLDALANQLAEIQLAETKGGNEASQEARDQLRQVIRERLEQARKTGSLQAGRPRVRRSAPAAAGGQRPPQSARSGGTGAQPKEGNAVYHISPDGFVREVFRESVMILKLLRVNGKLLVATGNEGEIYSVDPAAGETVILADLEPQQVPAMLTEPDGSILLATANPATLIHMDSAFSKAGKYTSPVLDSQQISLWGRIHLTTTIPPDTGITVQTRSGNVEDPEQAAWSPWSDPAELGPAEGDALAEPRELAVSSPPARFVQYKLNFVGDGRSSSVVHNVSVSYIMPNLKPVISTIQATYPEESGGRPAGGGAAAARAPRPGATPDAEPEPTSTLNISWEATDPNNDTLTYKLEYQPVGSKVWLLLEKDLTQSSYEWQTLRVPDGRYRIRVTASDEADNPANMALSTTRQTDPIVVDNTPPRIEDIKTQIENRTLTITGTITDSFSPIRSLHYGLNAAKPWKPVLPDGLIFDSTTETFTITIPDLAPGHHAVSLRALDARGNPAYHSVLVEVK